MSARLFNESRFHDRQAAERARALRGEDYVFASDAYIAHAPWIAPAFDALGEVRGRRILDLGCGHGMAAVVLARRGARVTACDLSFGYVSEARRRAVANQVDPAFVVCDGEKLPFADGAFDGVWGNAILHHLDLNVAAPELHRVLAPGGVGVFCEPWAGNRWLNWARAALPYPGKHRTADEAPLNVPQLAPLRAAFPDLTVRGFQFLSMLGRVISNRPLQRGLAWCDDQLLRCFPHWQRYCRYIVVTVRKH